MHLPCNSLWQVQIHNFEFVFLMMHQKYLFEGWLAVMTIETMPTMIVSLILACFDLRAKSNIGERLQFLQCVSTVTSADSHECEFAFLMILHQKWLHLRPAHVKLHFLCRSMQNITFTAFNKSRTLMQKRQRLRMKCFVLPERYFLIETKLSPKNVPAKIFRIYFWQKKYAQKHNLKFENQTWNNWSKLVVIK